MANLNLRQLRITLKAGGVTYVFDNNLAMTAKGIKYTSPNLGECFITISNLRSIVAEQIIKATTPFDNRLLNRGSITVEAGRTTTGYSLIFSGQIFRSSISQPPDKTITIRCISNFSASQNIISGSMPPISTLQKICEDAADNLKVLLVFEATDRNISNFSFNGSVNDLIKKISSLGGINCFVENGTLFVKDDVKPLQNRITSITPENIIGIPIFTDRGVKVSYYFDHETFLGGTLNIISLQYPTATGAWNIYKLEYDLANRDSQWIYTAYGGPAFG